MTDPISVTNALSALKTASEMVKLIRAADASLDKAELKMKIATLAEALADARLALLEVHSEIDGLRATIAEISAINVDRAHIEKRDNVYWINDEGSKHGPFCPRCFESDHKRMPVTEMPHAMRQLGHYRCPQCKATY
ncbi:MAG TPA: hypothetical protein VM053_11985 [Gemmatimonadaceae bacterium]|nr:hypothetical protein [Gemmatimonadaceae bacterium]